MIITISGSAASGKSEIGETIARELGMDFFSVNKGFVKELAARKGMAVKEYYEKHADVLDRHLDAWQQDLCTFMDGFVLDSKIGFHWSKYSPLQSFNIFLTCDRDKAAEVLSDGKPKEEAMRKVLEEEDFEKRNYSQKYGIDNFQNPKNFHFVLDTTNMTAEQAKDVILKNLSLLLAEEEKAFLSLISVYPIELKEKGHVYASTPHTTGKTYYHTLSRHGVKKLNMLDKAHKEILKEVLKMNEKEGRRFSNLVSSSFKTADVINPTKTGYFKGMTQSRGLALWRKFIRRHISKVFFNRGWEYSDGCVEEFYLATKEGVETYDHKFKPLGRKKGLEKIAKAMSEIKAMGFECKKLEFFHGEINRDVFTLLSRH